MVNKKTLEQMLQSTSKVNFANLVWLTKEVNTMLKSTRPFFLHGLNIAWRGWGSRQRNTKIHYELEVN